MNERIKLVREDVGLTQAAFGQRIGLSRDVINNLERGRVDAKDHIVKLICDEYQVQEEWLRTGAGPMYAQPSTFSLDEYVHDHGATELELEILKVYFALDPEIRKTIFDHFKSNFFPAHIVASKEPPGNPPNQNTETSFSVQAAEEDYIKKVLGSAPNTAYSALSSTSDTPSNKISNE